MMKDKGKCQATNPIDSCWRCDPNWAKNRQRLADCVQGFGFKTRGGKGGPIYVVTDASDKDLVNPKPGTLRHAVIQKGPLWITFARSMIITLTQELMVSCDKTIDGRGANVHISHGAGITLQFVKNVIVHGIHVHDIVPKAGGMIRDSVDHYGFRTRSDGDGISLYGATNIWIDHVQRMPRCRWGFFHVVNNDYTHWLMYAIGGSNQPTIISQGNRFIAPATAASKEVTKREYAYPSEWKHWDWISQDDLMINGAFFVPSGNPQVINKITKQQRIYQKSGTYATLLTRDSGALDCCVGKPC
ncbi:Probable pectate lyase 7 [Linum perenne]